MLAKRRATVKCCHYVIKSCGDFGLAAGEFRWSFRVAGERYHARCKLTKSVKKGVRTIDMKQLHARLPAACMLEEICRQKMGAWGLINAASKALTR